MKTLNIISTFCLFLFLLGCQPSSNFFAEEPDFLLYYGSGETRISDVQFNGYLKAHKSSQKLLLELRTTNNSKEAQQINLLEAVMESDDKRNFPIQASNEMVILQPGEMSIDTITFDAINNSFLHRFAGVNGDLINTYTLYPGGLIGETSKKRMLFQAEDVDFDNYIKQHGKDSKITVWTIDDADTGYELRLTNRIDAALSYSKELQQKEVLAAGHTLIQNPERPNFQITTNEILMGGIVFGIKSYEFDGEFRIKARIVNHQSLPLDIDISDFKLITDNQVLSATSVTSQNNIKELQLQKGQRAHIEFVYSIDRVDDSVLFVPNLSLSGMNESLLDSIPLSKVTPPNPELAQVD